MTSSDNRANQDKENKKESSKSYLEQTKLLVTLASAFIVAPAVLFKDFIGINPTTIILMESSFVLSVLSGYVVFGTISGTQYKGDYDIYRMATRISSLFQLAFYILGLIILILTFTKSAVKENSKEKTNIKKISSTVLQK